MQSFGPLRESFEQYLREHTFQQAPGELYAPINYIMGIGGKRLRPVLALLAHQAFRSGPEGALPVAMAVEIFHNFSLVHDDIMDEAPLRRGKTTVHEKYGLNAGILSGDAMLIYAYAFLARVEQQQAIPALLRVFNKVAIEVCEGQQYDINFESRQDVTIPEYLKMIELKTAALIGGSLEMGAIAAQAPEEDVARLAAFGRQIGIAFQLQDDYLDTFGDPEKFGKKVGGDIAQNKKTFLILKAQELAQGATRARLEQYMSTNPEEEAQKIAAVTSILRELGIPGLARALKEEYQEKAFAQLEQLGAPRERKEELRELALGLMEREA